MSERLSAADWINAGYRALKREGFSTLKADVLAKTLDVSRGSFYWHFSDLGAFHRAVIAHWQEIATEAIIAEIKRNRPGAEGLEWLLRQAMTVDGAAEAAMRAWAKRDEVAAGAVKAVDRRRRSYLVTMLKGRGLARDRAEAIATILYLTYLGNALSDRRPRGRQLEAVIAELTAMAARVS